MNIERLYSFGTLMLNFTHQLKIVSRLFINWGRLLLTSAHQPVRQRQEVNEGNVSTNLRAQVFGNFLLLHVWNNDQSTSAPPLPPVLPLKCNRRNFIFNSSRQTCRWSEKCPSDSAAGFWRAAQPQTVRDTTSCWDQWNQLTAGFWTPVWGAASRAFQPSQN